MKIIDRYLVREFITPFFYCTLAFFILYLVADLFEHMDEFIASQIPFQQLMMFYIYSLPIILIRTTPFSMVLACVYELGRFAKYMEVVGMQSSGISLKRIALPLFEIGILLSLLHLLASEFILPSANLKSSMIAQTYLADDALGKSLYQDIAYSSIFNNFVVYIQELDLKHRQARDIQLHQLSDQGTLKRVTRSTSGQWLDGSWWLFDGTVNRYDEEGNPTDELDSFKKMKSFLSISPADLVREENSSEHLNYKELRQSLIYKFGDKIPQANRVTLISKLTTPWVYAALILVIVPLGLKISRGGALMVLGKVILITLSYFGVELIFQALGKQGAIDPWLSCWVPIMSYLCLGTFLFCRLK